MKNPNHFSCVNNDDTLIISPHNQTYLEAGRRGGGRAWLSSLPPCCPAVAAAGVAGRVDGREGAALKRAT